jgi:hypothetical protein
MRANCWWHCRSKTHDPACPAWPSKHLSAPAHWRPAVTPVACPRGGGSVAPLRRTPQRPPGDWGRRPAEPWRRNLRQTTSHAGWARRCRGRARWRSSFPCTWPRPSGQMWRRQRGEKSMDRASAVRAEYPHVSAPEHRHCIRSGC